MRKKNSLNRTGQKLLVFIVILAMLIGSLPAEVFAAGNNELKTKTVTVWAVQRDPDSEGIMITTKYGGTQLRYLTRRIEQQNRLISKSAKVKEEQIIEDKMEG